MSLSSHFVTKSERLAIYTRDSFTCIYCNEPLAHDTNVLSLDHVVPRSNGGKLSDYKNLVCSCQLCNSRKADLTVSQFARRYGYNHNEIKSRIRNAKRRIVNVDAAKYKIRHYGSYSAAIKNL